MLRQVYPHRRRMDEAEVVRWALGLRTEAALAAAGISGSGTPFDDAAMAQVTARVPIPSVREAIAELEAAGIAEFAR